jgi:hypothetical protein
MRSPTVLGLRPLIEAIHEWVVRNSSLCMSLAISVRA